MKQRGALAIVLHTHMPYVEGFGTWPFGEEWLFEAMATCYLPLLDLLDREPGRLTLSLTPVLCDQLDAPELGTRFGEFVRQTRQSTIDCERELARATGDADLEQRFIEIGVEYLSSGEAFRARGGNMIKALAPHALWTSSATHAIIPLIATAHGRERQLDIGVDAFQRRFGSWDGGFWLPECAWSPDIYDSVVRAGIKLACVDLSDLYGVGSSEHLRPHRYGDLTLLPIDRQVIELVWSDRGYPVHGSYTEMHQPSSFGHLPWAVSGKLYDRDLASRQAQRDAEHFVESVSERVAAGGLSVCAIDTELFGHHWRDGVAWLELVLKAAAKNGLEIVQLTPDVLQRFETAQPSSLPPTSSWGQPRDLSTWSSRSSSDLAWKLRQTELDLADQDRLPARAVRELLALQSSDWAFLHQNDTAGSYPCDRFWGHQESLHAALATGLDSRLRNLAPFLESCCT